MSTLSTRDSQVRLLKLHRLSPSGPEVTRIGADHSFLPLPNLGYLSAGCFPKDKTKKQLCFFGGHSQLAILS